MKKCKYCNFENTDDAVFCINCGKPVEDGEENGGGEQVSEDSCTAEKQTVSAEYKPSDEKRAPVTGGNSISDKAKNGMKIAGSVLLGLGALLAIVFVFFSGLKISSKNGRTTTSAEYDIYYYIGGQYSDLAKQFAGNNADRYNPVYISAVYLRAALSTAAGLITLLGTVTFAVLTIVSVIKGLIKKSYSGNFYAVLTALIFICGSYWLLGLNYYKYKNTYSGDVVTGRVSLSGSTNLGLTLVCLCVIAGVALKSAAKVKNFDTRTIVKFASAAAITLFALIVVILSSVAHLTSKTDVRSDSNSLIMTAINRLRAISHDGTLTNNDSLTYADSFFTIVITIAITVIGVLLILKTVKRQANSTAGEIVLCAILTVLTFALYVCFKVAGRLNADESCASAVLPFLLSILMLGGAIFRKVFDNKTKTPETPAVGGNDAVATEIKAEPATETAETESIAPIE